MSGRDGPAFTPKQGQYLACIDAYTRVHRPPSAEWEMQRHFGVTPPCVHQMILTLERAGFIRCQPGTPRNIEVLVPPQHLPVLQANIQPAKTTRRRLHAGRDRSERVVAIDRKGWTAAAENEDERSTGDGISRVDRRRSGALLLGRGL